MQDTNCDIYLARPQLNSSKFSSPRENFTAHSDCTGLYWMWNAGAFLGQLPVKALLEESILFVDFSLQMKFTAKSLKCLSLNWVSQKTSFGFFFNIKEKLLNLFT